MPGKVGTRSFPVVPKKSMDRLCGRIRRPSDRVAAILRNTVLVGVALAALPALEIFLERQAKEPIDGSDQENENRSRPFDRHWLQSFGNGEPGCLNPPMDTYSWRTAGWGSNVNTLLLQWAEGLVSGRTDLAIIFDSDWPWFEQTTCEEASDGEETVGGWHCLFRRMPHLCVYDNQQEWAAALTPLSVSNVERGQALGRMGDTYARRHRSSLRRGLKGTGLNEMGALARLLDHIYSHFQPWFEDAVSEILDEPAIAALRRGKYVGFHIRRTDKIVSEARKTDTEAYFTAAAKYLDGAVVGPAVTDISGVWLSSDDESVLAEVQEIAPRYFPQVNEREILFISNRVPLKNNTSSDWNVLLKGAQSRNRYDAVVLLVAELRMLARADVFSGTFSSNIGRMVTLMRKTLHKPPRSAVSADIKHWRSG